jgi:hypothetical protein
MAHAFSLQVPANRDLRALAAEVAAKYVEMSGGAGAEARALAADVNDALEDVSTEGSAINVAFSPDPAGLRVTLQCGARSRTIRHPMPARRS